jgi:hypothetical protein
LSIWIDFNQCKQLAHQPWVWENLNFLKNFLQVMRCIIINL